MPLQQHIWKTSAIHIAISTKLMTRKWAYFLFLNVKPRWARYPLMLVVVVVMLVVIVVIIALAVFDYDEIAR
jgi:membrane-associated PAP2 superfamily phosphatase